MNGRIRFPWHPLATAWECWQWSLGHIMEKLAVVVTRSWLELVDRGATLVEGWQAMAATLR